MKSVMLFLVIAISQVGLFASDVDLATKAEVLYKKQNYGEALDVYKQLLAQGYQGKELYYNTANCYYKNSELGYAIAYYEKALKFDPSDEDVKANLRLLNSKITDKINDEEKGLGAWFKKVVFMFSADKWTSFGLIFWILAFAGLALLKLKWVAQTKRLTVVAWVGLVLGALFLVVGFVQYRQLVQNKHVVVVASTVSIKASPSESAKELYVLHEGAKINLHKQNSGWVEVSVNNDNYGWVQVKDIIRI